MLPMGEEQGFEQHAEDVGRLLLGGAGGGGVADSVSEGREGGGEHSVGLGGIRDVGEEGPGDVRYRKIGGGRKGEGVASRLLIPELGVDGEAEIRRDGRVVRSGCGVVVRFC